MRELNKIHLVTLLLFVYISGSSAGAEGFTFTRNLTLGIRGNDVSVLQQFLITRGFLKILTPTGYFGSLTRVALGAWQVSTGIYPPAGFLGPISRREINTIFQQALIYQPPVALTPIQGTFGATTTPIATTSVVIPSSGGGSPASPVGSPIRLKIPKLNIDAGFQYLGLKTDGTMDIPNNVVDVGWFTGSPRPGEKGSAIVTGHVAQIKGGVLTKPGVFIDLSELSPGDKLSVLNDKGESITFVVRESRLYDPTADATEVFTSADGGVHLNLITCEGTWNQAQLSYSQRLVVFTDLW